MFYIIEPGEEYYYSRDYYNPCTSAVSVNQLARLDVGFVSIFSYTVTYPYNGAHL